MTILEKSKTDALVYVPLAQIDEVKSHVTVPRQPVTYKDSKGRLLGIQLWIPRSVLESLMR